MNKEMESKLRDKVKQLLQDGTIRLFIGYEKGTDAFKVSPVIIKKPEDVNKLILNSACANQLSIYIMEDKKFVYPRGTEIDKRPIGILVKGCDSRSIVQLIAENKLLDSEIMVFGVPCTGVLDPRKMESQIKKLNIPNKAVMNMQITEEGENYTGEYEGQKWTFPKTEVRLDKCAVCIYPNPVLDTELLSEEVQVTGIVDYSDVEAIENMSIDEKWAFWKSQFSKCIRCYACRDICPECYCEECVVDPTILKITPRTTPQSKENKSPWIERGSELPETYFYQMTRMMHMMGRCTNCGECTRVCPVDIPLWLFTQKLEKEAKILFNHVTGLDKEKKPLLALIEEGDPNDFVK